MIVNIGRSILLNLVKRGAISTLSILMLLAIEILFAVMYEEGNRNEEITVISENVVACSSGEEYLESSRINDMTGYVYTKGTSLWLNGEEYITQSNSTYYQPQYNTLHKCFYAHALYHIHRE